MKIKLQRKTGIRPLIVRTVLRNARQPAVITGIICASLFGWFLFSSYWILSKDQNEEVNPSIIHSGLATAKKLTIVAIGCSRADGLLASLNSAKAMKKIPNETYLHICIDGCPNNGEVQSVAESFEWPFGEKIVTIRLEAFGLAKHISQCWTEPKPNEWSLFLEDDVLLAPDAMMAFDEALEIRRRHAHREKIIGIALHDSRVNQYCWRDRVRAQMCQEIQKLCNTASPTWTPSGSSMCHGKFSKRSWNLNQFPSSWGAWYEGSAWSSYQRYFEVREQLSIGESLILSVPHSFSNEWDSSWKKFFLELMFRAGWTVMYRVHPNQNGYATTLRSPGVHVADNLTPSEKAKKCLQSLPLDKSESFVPDKKLIKDPNAIQSFDYCIGETSIGDLVRQGKVSVSALKNYPTLATASTLGKAVGVLQSTLGSDAPLGHDNNQISWRDINRNPNKMSSGYEIDFVTRAEVLLVTSMASVDKEFTRTADSFSSFGGKVHFLIAAPMAVCRKIGRGNIFATCTDEVYFKNEGGNKLPSIPKLLQAARDFAGPNVRWIGLMNGDITIESKLPKLLTNIGLSEPCVDHGCAVVGQRYDIDWSSRDERLHSEWGMDYFIFNLNGIQFILDNELISPLTIGLIRWDSWLMATLALHERIHVIDISEGMRVDHYMDFKETYKSKTNVDRWNLNLADARFHFGRTDHANYRLRRSGELEFKYDAKALQGMYNANKAKYERNMLMEKFTNFTYTTGPLPNEHFQCLCDLLKMSVPGSFTEKICAASSQIATQANPKKPRPIFFYKSILDYIAASESSTNMDKTLQDLDVGRSELNCCVLLDNFDDPVRVPDIFWTFDAFATSCRCLAQGV